MGNKASQPKTDQRFGIDARAVSSEPAGKGRYVLGLLEGWAKLAPDDQLTIYTRSDFVRPAKWPSQWQVVTAPASLRGSYWIDRQARANHLTALLAPGNYSLGAVAHLPTVTVVHDIAVFVVPEARPSWKVRLAEKLFLTRALARSARILAVSNFTRTELINFFRVPSAKITVAANAPDDRFHPPAKADEPLHGPVRQRYHLPPNFLLFVSTLEPRKNLVRLSQAFAGLDQKLTSSCPLILVGRLGWSTGPILSALKPLEDQGLVRRLDYVRSEDLPVLYQLATAVVFPSLYEGFGLPALEALASGRPLLTSSTSALPEVVGEAALMVNPFDRQAIATGLVRLITDHRLRADLAQRGPRQAAQFTWKKTAVAARSALEQISQSP